MEWCLLTLTRRMRRRRGSLGKNWTVFRLTVGRRTIELAARAGFGYMAWSSSTTDGRTSRYWPASCYQEAEMMKKKRKASDTPQAKHLAAVESNVFKDLLSLVEHCAVTQYEDGDSRKPGWFTVRTFGSTWQIEIKDPDTLQMMRVTQPSLDDALMLAALLLSSEDAPWEADTWAQQQAKKSKK